MTNKKLLTLIIAALIFVSGTVKILAQTTEFTYQGRLTDTGTAANTNYDFQFALFDSQTAGNQIGINLTLGGVPVTGGVFTVRLDFGAQFTGAPRFLQIAVRQTGASTGFVTLTPRQAITSAPYSIKSINSTNADIATNSNNLGGIPASQYVQISDSRLIDDRDPLPGSDNYIQNRTSQQTSSNFNIGGSGTANIFSAATQFNIGANRVLTAAGTANTFVGIGAGQSWTNGNGNTFVGTNAGKQNTNGGGNSFFGWQSGFATTTGSSNSFFGQSAGLNNTTGANNVFVGFGAGGANTTANENTFVGTDAGTHNTTGFSNSFFGTSAGWRNATQSNNSFFGYSAGYNNDACCNSFFGTNAGLNNDSGTNNSFFGFNAGSVNTAGSNNSFFGRASGFRNTVGTENTFIGDLSGNTNTSGTDNTTIGYNADLGATGLSFATAIGAGSVVNASNTIALGRENGADKVVIYGLGSAGSTQLCRNALNQIATCSSSLRYKTNIAPFTFGLNVVKQLNPITFDWKADGSHDLGFGAEDVARVNELLVIRNEKGEVEGVKYDRISAVLVNAVNEQQSQFEQQNQLLQKQQEQIENLQNEILVLKQLVCAQNPTVESCRKQ